MKITTKTAESLKADEFGRIRVQIWITPNEIASIDNYRADKAATRAQIIRNAINFYFTKTVEKLDTSHVDELEARIKALENPVILPIVPANDAEEMSRILNLLFAGNFRIDQIAKITGIAIEKLPKLIGTMIGNHVAYKNEKNEVCRLV